MAISRSKLGLIRSKRKALEVVLKVHEVFLVKMSKKFTVQVNLIAAFVNLAETKAV